MDYDYNTIIERFIKNIKDEYGIKIELKNVHWRGIGSQGDSLCFDFATVFDTQALNFLKKIKARYTELFSEDLVESLVDIEIYTTQNQFANLYCHKNTRNVIVDIDCNGAALMEKDVKLYELLKDNRTIKDIEEDIKRWYNSKCDEMYNELEKHYNVVQELDEQENSSLIGNNEIDPDMNIDKVINLLQDATSLNHTKDEAYNLIEKFRENFKKEYLIIKKIK